MVDWDTADKRLDPLRVLPGLPGSPLSSHSQPAQYRSSWCRCDSFLPSLRYHYSYVPMPSLMSGIPSWFLSVEIFAFSGSILFNWAMLRSDMVLNTTSNEQWVTVYSRVEVCELVWTFLEHFTSIYQTWTYLPCLWTVSIRRYPRTHSPNVVEYYVICNSLLTYFVCLV